MKPASLILTLALVAGGGAAHAAGCVKGAVVGGVAGHLAHRHTVAGAAIGCAVGRHEAHKAQVQQQKQMQPGDRRDH